MKTPGEKITALLSAGLLALTLSACGADNDPDVEKLDEYEDEQAPDTQNNDDTIQDEDADTQDEE
ncbi:MAG: hypothetical protein ACTHWM_05190 [Yaniella sp.]|uniref:hypothetical protein n=1 Tax=Yaniella sp. TaxID=2773929 RepID=UPI003F9693D9